MITTKQSLDDRLATLVRPEAAHPGARLWIAGVPISRYSTLEACQHDARTIRAAIAGLCDDVIAAVLRKGLAGCPVSEAQLQALLDTDEIRARARRLTASPFPGERAEVLLYQIADNMDTLDSVLAYLLSRLTALAASGWAAPRN